MEKRILLNMDEVLLVRKYLELLTDTSSGRGIISDKHSSSIHYSMGELGELIKKLTE